MALKEKFSSPLYIFIAYIAAASACILGFRFVFPGEMSPLPIFFRNWHLTQGFIDIITLFPAIAFSALVIPFGIVSDDNYSGSSSHLLQRLMKPLIVAICAAGLYAVLFFLALPLAQNYKANLRFQGDVYQMAKEQAYAHGRAGEWLEASQSIGICDTVWYDSPELASLRTDLLIQLEEMRKEEDRRILGNEPARNLNRASVSALPGQGEPLNATEAIALGEEALRDERPFDAHWLATVGGRLARAGSPEQTQAARLAAQAWNQIESQRPNRMETRIHSIYQLKLSGYEAMVSGDWIRAYYIFQQLLELTPHDPDAENFFKASEKGTKEVAFFIDEMELSLGETLTNTMFSLPGRSVLRVASLSFNADYAYGTGIEYMVFDADANQVLSLQAPYAKFMSITIHDQPQVLVLMRTLDRHDSARRWEPQWAAQGRTSYHPDSAQITLNISYETFTLLSEMRQGLPGLYIDTLFKAAALAGKTGYIPEVYEAEILNRLGSCLFFLPMSVLVIVIGWRLRAKTRPRYLFVLSMPVLPIVFNGLVYLYHMIINTASITLITLFDFSFALMVFIIFLVVCFVLSLIALAAQRD
jgi:hypothetical protein